ncbi:cysteine--tRNA ligase [Candidatus Eisenbacteria bacterium]|uniref:Cysteine--tRNA ligase n=1 Tax=Eiseniibacteriota bacterium TaxID=2212470 RepID=A0ABV6YQ31_UNCEI
MTLMVYDTFDAKKKEFVPVKEGKVGMYMCGMTVQDRPHVGHMLAFTCGDMIRRYLEYKGYEVTYIQNFTDVDDKIIARANAEGVDYHAIAERYTKEYFKYADLLNIKRATAHPKATEHIQDIIDLVKTLEDKGFAYAAGGDVFFEIAKFPPYGRLSKMNLDELRAGARVEVSEHKRNPMDFVLWKGAKEGEPSWDSPWGKGRPGWAIECSVMSTKYYGETLDIHSGGEDLIFPHHENEIAQSEGATGQKFVNFWAHNGLLNLVGEKMSKSTGHFFAIEDIVKEFDPDVMRFYLLSSHYRSPMEFSRERLAEARSAVGRMANTFRAVEAFVGDEKPEGSLDGLGEKDQEFWKKVEERKKLFSESMDDDFNSAGAIGHIFDLAKDVNLFLKGEDTPAKKIVLSRALGMIKELGDVLGIFRGIGGEILKMEDLPLEARELVEERAAAREAKDWARADSLRTQLAAQGYFAEDRPTGTIIRK